MSSVTFLGTGGGRFVLLMQRRHTGGIWLDLGSQILLDPGPGSLVRALQYGKDPRKLDAVFVSHKHLDHYNDAEVLVEAMTDGGKRKRGMLVVSKDSLDYISEYHRGLVDVLVPAPLQDFGVGELKVRALPTFNHVDALGFRFFSPGGDVVYSSDTSYSKEVAGNYKNARLLILNVIFPQGKPVETHLNTDNAIEIVGETKPEFCVITHFGMSMLNANPSVEAKKIQEATGVETIAARDGQTIDLTKIGEKQIKLSDF